MAIATNEQSLDVPWNFSTIENEALGHLQADWW